jgi:ribonuclease HI
MLLDPHAIHIYTDGSCYRNPGGEAGCAAIVHYPDSVQLADEQIVDFGCAESSSNRMELMACIKALKWVRENQPWPNVMRVQIVTDSTYITDNISYRARGWKKNKWRNRFGKPMANDDLWDDLLAAQTKVRLRIDFVWQPGKKSTVGKAVDRAAKAAADRGAIDEDRGYRPGAVCRSMVSGGVAQPYPARGQSPVIRPYVKKMMFRGENRISFNVYVEPVQAFYGKYYAFAAPVMAVALHRWHLYRVRFNDDPNYPQIVECIEEVFPQKFVATANAKPA